MRKKKPVEIEYLVDGEQSSLLDIVEQNPDSQMWKSYLEKENLQKSESAKRYIEAKIGDHLSASEINKRTGISTRILDKWRKAGSIKAENLKGRWYYSLSSVVNAIKTADIEDLR